MTQGKERAVSEELRVGDLLVGYAGGPASDLGPDKVRVEAIGADWVVVRALSQGSSPQFYPGRPQELLWAVCRRDVPDE